MKNFINPDFEGKDFWKNYMIHWFGEDLIEKWEKHVELRQIDSVKGKINIEIYRTADPANPTLVFSHGIAGYARLLLPFLMPLFEKGYNIIAPDLEGYGFNERKKGDFSWEEHLANLNDSVEYAKTQFNGKIYLGGGSMGGPLAYATDVRYNCADGLICWCLWDFADKEFVDKTGAAGKLTLMFAPVMKLVSTIFGKATFKSTKFVSYRDLTSSKQFNALIMQDPQSGNRLTLRGALSMVTQSKPDLKHELYKKPVLVCQPKDDKMTEARFTRRIYDRLGSENKQYVDFTGGHWPVEKDKMIKWGEVVDQFIKEAA